MKKKAGGLKPLLPTLKEKKRYLAFEIISKSKLAFADIKKAIWASILSFAGTKGASAMGVQVLPEKYNAQKQKGIIRVTHTGMKDLKASLTLINQIQQQPVIVRSTGASGILAKAEKRYI